MMKLPPTFNGTPVKLNVEDADDWLHYSTRHTESYVAYNYFNINPKSAVYGWTTDVLVNNRDAKEHFEYSEKNKLVRVW